MNAPVAKARDIFNTEEIKEWLSNLGNRKSKEFKLWLSRNAYNWVVREYPKVRMVAISKHRPLMTMLASLLGKTVDENTLPVLWVKPSEAPAWLNAKLDDGHTVLSVILTQDLETTLLHCWDYVRSELKGEDLSRYAVPDMIRASEEWTKRLERIKIAKKDLAAAEVVVQYPEHQLVRLITKGNYDLEGKRMHNCVASYYNDRNDGVAIYSYRTSDNTPIFTIQINFMKFAGNTIAVLEQVMGRYPSDDGVKRKTLGNRPLTYEEKSMLVTLLQQPNLFGDGVRFIADIKKAPADLQYEYDHFFGCEDDDYEEEDEEDYEEDDEDNDW